MKSDLAADEAVLDDEPVVETPVRMDYGYNVRIAKNAFINSSSTFIDTCPIIIGSRTLVGPNVSFYSGTHPLDPFLRNGTKGPETGKDIVVGEDCWIGGHAIILPGVTLGRGVVIGAGSVVTKVRRESSASYHDHGLSPQAMCDILLLTRCVRTFPNTMSRLEIRHESYARSRYPWTHMLKPALTMCSIPRDQVSEVVASHTRYL